VLCGSFREAAERRGLIEADNTLDECLTESEQFAMPASLRRLFATILVFCEPGDVRGLWDRHLEAMSEDYRRRHTCPNTVEQMVLLDISGILQSRWFADYLLRVGNGTEEADEEGNIRLPEDICVPSTGEDGGLE